MKFKIGQKVIFTAKPSYCRDAQSDSGNIAIIVKCYSTMNPGYDIFIKNSTNKRSIPPAKVTWCVPEEDLSQAVGQQLLFSFMSATDGI